MITFGVVGTGWRTEFFLRVANALPEQFRCVGVVTRDAAKHADWARALNTTLYESLDEMLAADPLFAVTSVPWDVNPGVIEDLTGRGVPVLSETPPARTIPEMEALYGLVQGGAKIAVAEQYHLQPHHAARLTLANSGVLGTVSYTSISLAHGYHGISLIRRALGVGYEAPTITARAFTSPVMAWMDRSPVPEKEEITESTQTLAWLDWGDKLGVFDFVPQQYWAPYRGQRVCVRGERGEIIDDQVTYVAADDYPTVTHARLERHYTGVNGNLEGHALRGITAGGDWVYENPTAPARFFDDEIAVAVCLRKMADYVNGAEAFYPLAEACQDRYLDILIERAAETGAVVQAEQQVWV